MWVLTSKRNRVSRALFAAEVCACSANASIVRRVRKHPAQRQGTPDSPRGSAITCAQEDPRTGRSCVWQMAWRSRAVPAQRMATKRAVHVRSRGTVPKGNTGVRISFRTVPVRTTGGAAPRGRAHAGRTGCYRLGRRIRASRSVMASRILSNARLTCILIAASVVSII